MSLSFPPTQAFLREELAVCMGKHSLLVFRLWHSQTSGTSGTGLGGGRKLEEQDPNEAEQRTSSSSSHQGPGHRPLNLSRILELEQEVIDLSPDRSMGALQVLLIVT